MPRGALARYVQSTCTESTAKIKSATMSMRVAVLGGGVGGLSAAHELIERDFDVSVYERRDVIGGKVRRLSVPSPGPDGRKDFAGGLGFCCFSSFYPQLADILKLTPLAWKHTVFDNFRKV